MSDEKVKIKMMLPGSDWYTFKAETVWATPVGENLYRVENPPFFADNISYHDVVFAIEHDGYLLVKSVRQRSGHSTYRIMPAKDVSFATVTAYIEPLTQLGCTYGVFKVHQLALNAPAGAAEQVDILLGKGEEESVLIYEASHRYNEQEEL